MLPNGQALFATYTSFGDVTLGTSSNPILNISNEANQPLRNIIKSSRRAPYMFGKPNLPLGNDIHIL